MNRIKFLIFEKFINKRLPNANYFRLFKKQNRKQSYFKGEKT